MVVLRKGDSATSFLLFVYNNYLTEYKKDTLKLSSLLEIMRAFGKSESATRMSLSRTVKAGILVNQNIDNEVYYSLASGGKKAIDIFNDEIKHFWKRYARRNSPWDSKWHLVNLELGEAQKDARNEVSERLKALGFGLLAANTWISPYYQYEGISEIISEFDLSKNMLELVGEMKVHQDRASFVESIFHIRKLEDPYIKFIKTFETQYEEIKKVYREEAFINEGKALPLMHALGWEFFFIAAEDAALPKALWPNWAGDEAVRLMAEFRKILLEAASGYLAKFNQKES